MEHIQNKFYELSSPNVHSLVVVFKRHSTSTSPCSWDVWDVVGLSCFNAWDGMTFEDSNMVAPISPPS